MWSNSPLKQDKYRNCFPSPVHIVSENLLKPIFKLLVLFCLSSGTLATSRVHLTFLMSLLYVMAPCYGSKMLFKVQMSFCTPLEQSFVQHSILSQIVSNSRLKHKHSSHRWSVPSVTGSMENCDLFLLSKECLCNAIFIWSL